MSWPIFGQIPCGSPNAKQQVVELRVPVPSAKNVNESVLPRGRTSNCKMHLNQNIPKHHKIFLLLGLSHYFLLAPPVISMLIDVDCCKCTVARVFSQVLSLLANAHPIYHNDPPRQLISPCWLVGQPGFRGGGGQSIVTASCCLPSMVIHHSPTTGTAGYSPLLAINHSPPLIRIISLYEP